MFPLETTFDEAARFLLRVGGGPFLLWLLKEPPEGMRFRRWLDSVLTMPGTKERLCDAIARLETSDGAPSALLVEIQTIPDPSMFSRLSLAGGILTETVKPNDLPGDRYGLMGLVINLTGIGNSERSFETATTAWGISPCERDFAKEDAAVILAGVKAGTIPQVMLAFIPAMQKGGDADIIKAWLDLVRQEPDARKRGVLTLAVVFAQLTKCEDAWRKALEGFDVMESTIVNEWKAEAERKATAAAVLRCLRVRFTSVPEDLARSVSACSDMERMNALLEASAKESSLDDFRRVTGV